MIPLVCSDCSGSHRKFQALAREDYFLSMGGLWDLWRRSGFQGTNFVETEYGGTCGAIASLGGDAGY